MLTFFERILQTYRTTGAIAPSGPVLAKEMTRALSEHAGPKRVLEVGPGSGAFTKHILKALVPGDEFHVVEINPAFCDLLERNVFPKFRQESDPEGRITIQLYNDPIELAPLTGKFHYIVCGLPFNNFPLHQVSLIFRRMMSHLHEGGELAYFEYLGMKAIKMPWVGAQGRERLKRRIALTQTLDRRWSGSRNLVLRNFPPANAIKLRA